MGMGGRVVGEIELPAAEEGGGAVLSTEARAGGCSVVVVVLVVVVGSVGVGVDAFGDAAAGVFV